MNGSQDLSGIIGKLTENPEMMKSLMGIAGKLMNGEGEGDARESFSHSNAPEPSEYIPNRPHPHPQGCKGDGKEDCGNCQCPENKNADCRRKEGRGNDAENLIRLLIALKPYVGKERCEKIDGIVKILKLVQLSEKTGLFKSLS